MPRNNNKELSQINLQIGEMIKTFRTAQGLSRQQLAVKIGVTHQQLAKYERGENRVSAARLTLLAKVFGKNLNDFVDTFNDVLNRRSRINLEMLRMFDKLNDKTKEAVANMTRALVEEV